MERLQKVIAHAGITSRWEAEEFILAGRIRVNGQVVKELEIKVGKHDAVKVDETPICQEGYGCYLLHKSKGVILAVTDDKGRKVVTDLLPMVKERIYPVGRLDYDTPGVLLLTDDGDFVQRLTYPEHEVDKAYVAKVKGIAAKSMSTPLTKGIKIEGQKTFPAKSQILPVDPKTDRSIVELTTREGRNRQVKNILQVAGLPVQKSKCEECGNLTLQGLRPGDYRELNKKEVSSLLNHLE